MSGSDHADDLHPYGIVLRVFIVANAPPERAAAQIFPRKCLVDNRHTLRGSRVNVAEATSTKLRYTESLEISGRHGSSANDSAGTKRKFLCLSFDSESGEDAPSLQRDAGNHRSLLNAGNAARPLQRFCNGCLAARERFRIIGVTHRFAEIRVHGDDVVSSKAEVHAGDFLEAAGDERGANHENYGEGNFEDHQRAEQTSRSA